MKCATLPWHALRRRETRPVSTSTSRWRTDHKIAGPERQPLTVLPSSGKVEELKREVQENPPVQPTCGARLPPRLQVGKSHPLRLPVSATSSGKVEGVLRTIYDPEIPVNIYDLGLIYEVKVDETDAVFVKMTLTAPACPWPARCRARSRRRSKASRKCAPPTSSLVWDPPWSKDRMSESAMLDLGFL